MYKKYFFLCVICALFTLTADAQQGIKQAAQAALRSEQITRVLQKRVQLSFQKANALRDFYSPLVWKSLDASPYLSLSHPLKNPQKLYPQMNGLLTTRQQWSDYLIASNNRRVTLQLPQEKQRLNELQLRTPERFRQQQTFMQPAKQYMNLLAQQIPPDTQYLLLGETHVDFIADYVANLLPKIRDNNPGREIILFTEFLSEGTHKRMDWLLSKHVAVFATAEAEQIPFVGLEPTFVEKNKRVFLKDNSQNEPRRVWESLEGLAIRNQHWLNVLYQQRQKHPEALFIVYAGAAHLAYNKPYSVAKALAGEKTFTAFLFTDDLLHNEQELVSGPSEEHELLRYASPYDYFSLISSLEPSPFIKFNKPQALQVGFDTRLFLKPKY
ncbi:MAG: hypothetical protein MJ053_06340 [Elusimicrobiaceae bacterium]|nr:hypothetical protein [Elusimicrobiaceae bacterium]